LLKNAGWTSPQLGFPETNGILDIGCGINVIGQTVSDTTISTTVSMLPEMPFLEMMATRFSEIGPMRCVCERDCGHQFF
jgi:hypothetical protein